MTTAYAITAREARRDAEQRFLTWDCENRRTGGEEPTPCAESWWFMWADGIAKCDLEWELARCFQGVYADELEQLLSEYDGPRDNLRHE